MNKFYPLVSISLFTCMLSTQPVKAQFSLTGQLRTRTELRDGYGNLPSKGAKAALFTSQRARLNFGYSLDKLKFFTAVQDVRIWGQDASTISSADGNRLMLHEVWSEINFASAADSNSFLKVDYLGLKIGRQEISYDDQRLLGNLDWLQQGRRHDAAILKFMHHGVQADLGVAFNQNTEYKEGKIYVPGNVATGTPAGSIPATGTANPAGSNGIGMMYKSFQYLYLSKKINNTKISGLLFKDDFQKYIVAEAPATGRVFVNGVNSRITSGLNVNTGWGKALSGNKFSLNLSAYHQGNKDKDGNALDAYFASIYAGYQAGNFTVGPGFDFYSGNDGTRTNRVNRRFDPLYGTPHKFAGYLDYFYAADGHGLAGLKDLYLKTRYRNHNFSFAVDAHQFMTASPVGYNPGTTDAETGFDQNLGAELDFTANYTHSRFVSLELGYAHMFGTSTLERVKTNGFPATGTAVPKELNANWAYLMINIKPDFLFAKTAPGSHSGY